jgi:hypothetical protein
MADEQEPASGVQPPETDDGGTMHIHKAKPFHGVREFLREYAIIVLGVITALAAEQAVEWLHWRSLVAEGRGDLAASYASLKLTMRERQLMSGCIGRRLGEIGTILDQASETGRLPPIGDIGTPPDRLWAEPSWQTLVTTGTAAHFPRSEAARYAGIETYVETMSASADREVVTWTRLYTIVGPGRRTGDTELASLRGALADALYEARGMKLGSDQITRDIDETPLDTSGWRRRHLPGFDLQRGERAKANAICRPIGPAPTGYNEAPLQFLPL